MAGIRRGWPVAVTSGREAVGRGVATLPARFRKRVSWASRQQAEPPRRLGLFGTLTAIQSPRQSQGEVAVARLLDPPVALRPNVEGVTCTDFRQAE